MASVAARGDAGAGVRPGAGPTLAGRRRPRESHRPRPAARLTAATEYAPPPSWSTPKGSGSNMPPAGVSDSGKTLPRTVEADGKLGAEVH
ncbi:hypothetical protein GCM10023194_46270 [Planotetraspora phitsanulokensis]|uniref:Uncharacterized protein n=1 Tax=Planotetraspora phitsanulokensis TaxID=575192 RepID=A0A8J3UD07_9ACTN|nr:hypothetical protein Pph01_60740 [Planotetraspora phitsanulokensis]